MLVFAIFSSPVFAEHVIDDSENPQYLVSLSSNSVTFKDDILTLKGVPLAVYFTDRLVRKAGHLTLEEFIAMWNQGADEYMDNPPNAELAIYEKDGDKHSVVILSKPKLNGVSGIDFSFDGASS